MSIVAGWRLGALACALTGAIAGGGCRFGFDDTTRSGLGPDGGGGGGNGGNGDGGGDGGGSDSGLMLAPTVRLAAGAAHTGVITHAGTVRCWGDNQYGQLGYGNTTRIGDNEAPSTAGDVQLGGVAVASAPISTSPADDGTSSSPMAVVLP